eukprot:403332184
MFKIPFPSKYIPLSSSVIIIRPRQPTTYANQINISSNYNYQILLLKRNSKISFGNFFAFPGGMLEKQDLDEKWQKINPGFYKQVSPYFQDFQKRVCALRELFEETNLLFSSNEHDQNATLNHYLKKYKSEFHEFCKDMNVLPNIEDLYGFQRVGSPIGLFPANDTQFYLYFMNQKEHEQKIVLNEEEFTEYKWLAPDEALEMYSQNLIPLFPPQVNLLSHMMFLPNKFDKLQEYAQGMNTNITNYLTNKNHYFSLPDVQDETELKTTVKKIFDKSDLKSDEQRSEDLFVWNNQAFIDKHPELKLIGKEKTYDELVDICKNVYFGVWYGDHYSTNDSNPYTSHRHYRRRIWTHKTSVIRVEMSKALLDQHSGRTIDIVKQKL